VLSKFKNEEDTEKKKNGKKEVKSGADVGRDGRFQLRPTKAAAVQEPGKAGRALSAIRNSRVVSYRVRRHWPQSIWPAGVRTARGRIPAPAVWSSTQGSYPASAAAISTPPPPQVGTRQARSRRWPPKLRRLRLRAACAPGAAQ
jgi:hypothetical protein